MAGPLRPAMSALPLELGAPVAYLRRSDLPTTTVLGSLLVLASTALTVLPSLLLAGYLVRLLATGLRDDPVPPAFHDWRGLGRDGPAAAAVSSVAGVVPLLALLATGRLLAAGDGTAASGRLPPVPFASPGPLPAGGELGSAAGGWYGPLPGPAFLGGVVVTLALVVAFGYLGFVALLGYARTGSLRTALDPRRVRAVATRRRTLLAALGCAVVVTVAKLAALLAAVAPLVGPSLAAAVTFHGWVVAARLAGTDAPVAGPVRPRSGTDPGAEPTGTRVSPTGPYDDGVEKRRVDERWPDAGTGHSSFPASPASLASPALSSSPSTSSGPSSWTSASSTSSCSSSTVTSVPRRVLGILTRSVPLSARVALAEAGSTSASSGRSASPSSERPRPGTRIS